LDPGEEAETLPPPFELADQAGRTLDPDPAASHSLPKPKLAEVPLRQRAAVEPDHQVLRPPRVHGAHLPALRLQHEPEPVPPAAIGDVEADHHASLGEVLRG